MKMAIEEVERLIVSHPELPIKNPEVLIASFLQSATSIYIHESIGRENKPETD